MKKVINKPDFPFLFAFQLEELLDIYAQNQYPSLDDLSKLDCEDLYVRFKVKLASLLRDRHYSWIPSSVRYSFLQKLQQQLDFLDVQEEYIKDEQRNLKNEYRHAQEEMKRIQCSSSLLMTGCVQSKFLK